MPAENLNMPTSPTWFGGVPQRRSPAAFDLGARTPARGNAGGGVVTTGLSKPLPWQTNENPFLDHLMMPGTADWSPNAIKGRAKVNVGVFDMPPADGGGGAGGGSRGGGGHGGGGGTTSFAPAAFSNGNRYNDEGARPDGRHRIEGGVARPKMGALDDFYALQGMGIGNAQARNDRVDALNDKGITSGFGGGAVDASGNPVRFDEWGALPRRADGGPVVGAFIGNERGPEAQQLEDGSVVPLGDGSPGVFMAARPVNVLPNETLTSIPGMRSLRTPYGNGVAVDNGPGVMLPMLPAAQRAIERAPGAVASNPGAEAAMGKGLAVVPPSGNQSAPSFGKVAAGFGDGSAFDVSSLPNLDGRPDGVDKRTWKRFAHTPSFAAMAWESQNADRRYDTRGKAEKTDKAQHEADAVEGTKAALKMAYPAVFTPEMDGALARMKPSVAAGFLNGIAGHLAQQDRERGASAPGSVPDGYEAVPSEFTTSGAPKKYELVKKPQPSNVAVTEVPGVPGRKVISFGNALAGVVDTSPQPAKAPQTIKGADGRVLQWNGRAWEPVGDAPAAKPVRAPVIRELRRPGGPGQPEQVDYLEWNQDKQAWGPMTMVPGAKTTAPQPSGFLSKFAK